jgi:hypothetical protein
LKQAGKITDQDIAKLRHNCAHLLRRTNPGKGHDSDGEGDGGAKGGPVELKPGEFLDLLVRSGPTPPPQATELLGELNDMVEKLNTDFIADAQWIRATAEAAGPPDETPELSVFTAACTLDALLAQIE